MLRALIVDDEPPARDLMRRLLAAHRDRVEVVGEARSVADAAEKCAALRPDLVFLDVQMPREDGFALLPRLSPPLPAIVFVTAYDQFAVRAFEVNAVDYLLKPVATDRLERALARVTRPVAASVGERTIHHSLTLAATPSESTPPPLLPSDIVFLRTERGLRTAAVAAITHIEAEENYTRVHLANDAPVLMRRSMTEWEKIVPADLFVRVERSLLINRTAVRQLDRVSRDLAHAHLAGRAAPLPLARRASQRLRDALSRFGVR